jgi:hypothetical protein
MKYIILRDKGPIIFGGIISHNEMANKFPNDEVIGAGMINAGEDDLQVYGESVSLQIKSKPADQSRINYLVREGC